jgi:hypothetical protein
MDWRTDLTAWNARSAPDPRGWIVEIALHGGYTNARKQKAPASAEA